ncbi:MAG: hypothetical protein FJY82_00320 [Candidatus Aminicenantes bacterium]|nr:hypothetical protein [Candidatus Aminicenantes bacterium]
MRNGSGRTFQRGRKVGQRLCGLAAVLVFASAALAQPETSSNKEADALLARLQEAFAASDREAYLASFVPEIREREWDMAFNFLSLWKMTGVKFHRASPVLEEDGRPTLYLQVLYENPTSAMFETWQLGLKRTEAGLVIGSKDVAGNITTLYKLRMPSGRTERARRVEISHQDIVLTFENAWVVRGNIPETETALLILGPGRLRFAPSSAVERHQLDLRFKSSVLEDRLESAYLRFSPAFFKDRIRIEPDPGPAPMALPEPEAKKARALFDKFYPGSFTVENSMTDELLTFIPQGDQVVFEFKTAARGDMAYIFSPFSEEEIHFLRRKPDQIISLYSPETPAGEGRRMFVSFGQKFDVESYEIDLDFQPERMYLSARAKIEASARVGPLDSLQFNFNSGLEIVRVYDRDGRELFYTQDRQRQLLYVYFLRPVEKEGRAAVEIFYRGSLPPPLQTADILPGQFSESVSLILPKYESYLYSQSALWYPAPSEDEYFQARVRLIFPPGFVCVANGDLVEEGKIDGGRRVLSLEKVGNPYRVFSTRVPVKYLSFIIGKFDKSYGGNGTARPAIQVLVSEDIRIQRKTILEEVKAVLAAYEGWFGPFPYEKLTVLQRIWPTGGGHSPASFVVLNELPRTPDLMTPIANPDSPVDLSRFREYALAHEIAHQWWGQAVTGATYREQWLSEGLAQFAAAEYLRQKYGERTFAGLLRRFVQWTGKKSVFGPITLGTRISLLDFAAYQAVVYNKTCVVLNMLRDLVGEEAFFRGLRSFFESRAFRPARTSHFRQAMEEASGRDLGPFFRGWFDSHLLPEVQVKHDVGKTGSAFALRFKVSQPKTAFVFPLVVAWQEGGKTVRRTLDVDAPTKEFVFEAAARPAKVKVDPDGFLPARFLN